MVRSWRDRAARFGLGAIFGFSLCVLLRHPGESLVWCGAGLALILGMGTADIESKRGAR